MERCSHWAPCFWLISPKWLTFQAKDIHTGEGNNKVLGKSAIKKGGHFFKRQTLSGEKLLAFKQIRQAQVYVKNHEFTVGLIQSWSLTEDIIFFRGALQTATAAVFKANLTARRNILQLSGLH